MVAAQAFRLSQKSEHKHQIVGTREALPLYTVMIMELVVTKRGIPCY